MSDFNKKIAFVTGGGDGIGRATSVALSACGAKVIVTDINEKMGKQTVDQIKSMGNEASFFKMDVSVENEVKSITEIVIEENKKIDLAINNAGVGGDFESIHKTDLYDWNSTLNINLNGVFLCMKYQIKYMLRNRFGRIVNVSSMAGLKGVGGGASYSASKHGVIGLTKSAAIEYGDHNIRVNSVCPGFIDTKLIRNVPYKVIEFNKKINPMKRIGKTKEVADSILWLLSEKSSFVNGHSISIDGGYGSL
ncbi:MAG: hypothetical protein CMC53_02625 [Flavobacteriaceae bacterium]|nr:hypothetical protein [Flavobacteriaceae bacterium]